MEAVIQQGCRKGVRLQLRFKLGRYNVKGDVRKGQKDDKWTEKAANREKWKGVTTGAVQQYKN